MSKIYDENIMKLLNLFASNQQKHYILHQLKISGEVNAYLNHPSASPALKSAIKELLSEHPELQK